MKRPYKHSKLIAPNTYRTLFENQLGEKIEEIQYYDTVIIHISSGRMVIDSGGWMTATTKERLNNYMPNGYRVQQIDGAWYLNHNNTKSLFIDGMTITL